ncbi:MAG: YdcF family protein [Desulfobulbaceae bacterium]|nr:YdcF family protein [Desulfobulbaceae bacterium]
MFKKRPKLFAALILFFVSISSVVALPNVFLPPLAHFLIVDQKPKHADVVVVLSTGMEYYSRLMEAASLYTNGYADKVVINGNRKNDELRALERIGFKHCCPWEEDTLRVLELLKVPREDVIAVSAEDCYDTTTEADVVAEALKAKGIKSIIITSSKTHTRRAYNIWQSKYGDSFDISCVAAKNDPFKPDAWWKDGRNARWILYEYGSWCFYYWKTLTNK